MGARKQEFTLFPSAGRTVTPTPAEVYAPSATQAIFWLNVSAHVGATGTLDVAIKGKDPISGAYVTIASFAQVTTVDAAQMLALGAGADRATAPLASLFPVPEEMQVTATLAGTSPNFTFSVGATLITPD